MIKILTGFSERGGSTMSFIRLTNLFNSKNIKCVLYGPHQWHLDKCESGLIQNAFLNKEDIVVAHFLPIKRRPNVKKIVLSCHEKNLYEVGSIKPFWDSVIFLNQKHRDYHKNYSGDYHIIPNLKDSSLQKLDKESLDNIAGVVGSIDENKQTHISIKRALTDNCDKVLIYGTINDVNYYNRHVKDLIDGVKVIHKNFEFDKQVMYNSIGRVYHSSLSECACLVKDECYQTNTKFFGNVATDTEVSMSSNDEILDLWKGVLGI
jgi:hypothetical protein